MIGMNELKRNSCSGFTLFEVGILVVVVGLLVAIILPNFKPRHRGSPANACINNLRQMDGAVQQYALEQKLASSSTYTLSVIKPYIKLDSNNNIPGCPASGTYSQGASVTNPPTCSLSANTPAHALP